MKFTKLTELYKMTSKLNEPKLSAVKIIESFKVAGKTEETKMFVNLVILENENLCLATSGHWYCRCQQMINEFELQEGHKCYFCIFVKIFENLL